MVKGIGKEVAGGGWGESVSKLVDPEINGRSLSLFDKILLGK